jgi:hypothetical protein
VVRAELAIENPEEEKRGRGRRGKSNNLLFSFSPFLPFS